MALGASGASGMTGANSPGVRVIEDTTFTTSAAAKMRGTIHIVTGATNKAGVYISNGKTITRLRTSFAS